MNMEKLYEMPITQSANQIIGGKESMKKVNATQRFIRGVSFVLVAVILVTSFTVPVHASGQAGAVAIQAQRRPFAETAQPSAQVANGIYWIQNVASGLVLDVSQGSRNNGARIWMYHLNHTPAQQWRLERQSNGSYAISAVHSGLMLEVRNSSFNSGAQVAQWSDANIHTQRWFIYNANGNLFELVNSNSGLALDVMGGSTQNRTFVQQYRRNGTAAQRFRLIPVNQPQNNQASNSQFQAQVNAPTTGGLNLRASANTSARVNAVIPHNTTVTVTRTTSCGRWGRTSWNGNSGYLYLSHTRRHNNNSTQNYSQMNRRQLAQEILNRHNAGRLTLSSTSQTPNGNPLNGIRLAANGHPAPTRRGGGHTTHLNENMLRAILILSDHYRIHITSITGGPPSRYSAHNTGNAFDVGMVNDRAVSRNHNHRTEMENLLRQSGLTVFESLGPDNEPRGHGSHIHFAVR